MDTVKLSPKYQVMIPKPAREAMSLRPGQEVAVIRYRDRIELVPMSPVSSMRGMLRHRGYGRRRDGPRAVTERVSGTGRLNVVDSPGWIEYSAEGPNAPFSEAAIVDADSLVAPAISVYEVFERLLREPDGESLGLRVMAAMQRGRVVDLDAELALEAARLAYEWKMPMAAAVIFVTAYYHNATVLTQDTGFEEQPGVNYAQKRPQDNG